jgi:hypothetical protein
MGRRRSWGRIYLFAGVVIFLIQAGCGEPTERQQAREAAKFARENRADRRAAHREALPAIRVLREDIVPAQSPTPGCGKEVRSGARAVDGVLPVACGNLGERWPLTVEYGFLRCLLARYEPPENRYVVITVPSGRDFAVNRPARYVGYAPIAPIFKSDAGPRYGGALAQIGTRLCKQR